MEEQEITQQYLNVETMTREDKQRIVQIAKTAGCKATAIKYRIPWKTIRAWLANFAREEKKAKQNTVAEMSRDLETASETIISHGSAETQHLKVELKPIDANGHRMPNLPEFSNDWDVAVQLEWLHIWKELYGRPQVVAGG